MSLTEWRDLSIIVFSSVATIVAILVAVLVTLTYVRVKAIVKALGTMTEVVAVVNQIGRVISAIRSAFAGEKE